MNIIAHPKTERNPSMARIDRLETELDNIVDDKRELFRAYRRCLKACRAEFASFARECAISGGNAGLTLALDGLTDLFRDMAYDSLVRLDEQALAVSSPLRVEYRKQGVA